MHAMVLRSAGTPLVGTDRDDPHPGAGQVAVKVRACGVCRTDLHLVDGELPNARLPVIPGHEIVGLVTEVGDGVTALAIGDRVGIPWLGYTCGVCSYCVAGQENLCDAPRFTGCSIDGGYADCIVADSRYCFRLPSGFSDIELAPWLCAGLIGYRALRKTGDARRLGIYGFGAAAHIIAQIARYEGRETFAFTRPGDTTAQTFARRARCGVGRRQRRTRARPTRRGHSARPGGRARSQSATRRGQRRNRRMRRDSHERHSPVSL